MEWQPGNNFVNLEDSLKCLNFMFKFIDRCNALILDYNCDLNIPRMDARSVNYFSC